MAGGGDIEIDYDGEDSKDIFRVKVICLGDSAVGKSKLVERFLLDKYKPHQLSTYALTLFRYETNVNEESVVVGENVLSLLVKEFRNRTNWPVVDDAYCFCRKSVFSKFSDFWDTAGQEMFQSLHPSYYHQAHACIMVFDATRKITYKNIGKWYEELRYYRPQIPVLCAANKIDANMEVTQRSFAFPQKNNLPMYYVSASDGTNVVKLFRDAIHGAVQYKKNPTDISDQILEELERL